MAVDWDWNCDCDWDDSYTGPPVFALPPPPLPPSLGDEFCSADACPASRIDNIEHRFPDGVPFPVVMAVSTSILVAVIVAIFCLLCRYVRQRKLRRLNKNTNNVSHTRNGDDTAIYDELLLYNTRIRPINYEMADVIKSPCHLTTYPLLAEPQHYAQYQDPDFFQSPNPLDHSEPLYEELEQENGDSALHNSSRFFSKELAYRNTSHLNRNGSTQRSGRSTSLNRTPGYPELSASGTQYRSRTPNGSVQRERSPRPSFYRGRCPPEVPPFSEPTNLEKNIQIPDFYNQSPQYYCNTHSSTGSGRRSATRPDTRNGTAKLSRKNSMQH